MAELNRFSRWLVNRRNRTRSTRAMDLVRPILKMPESASVLEMGAGAAGVSALVYERYHPARLVTTDFDPTQVEAARRALTVRFGGLPSSIELRTADATHLPFEPGSFDCVFAMMMFHHVEARHSEFLRRPEAVREVRRVLRPGGRLVYSELSRRKEFRECLGAEGFIPEYLRAGWGRDLAVYRAPG